MKKYFDKFEKLVQDQFLYGGKKYAHSTQKESTDCLFDAHGKNWLFGTIDKYTYRFGNLARERDLLKIACYMYILWLKRGFHVDVKGVNDPPIDTTVDVKVQNFKNFMERVDVAFKRVQVRGNQRTDKELIQDISNTLKKFSSVEWKDLNEGGLLLIYISSFLLWERNFKETAGQDADTWLEDKGYGKKK